MREERKIFLSQREFWNQVKKKKKREGAGERKSSWNVLMNEGEKESKKRGRDSGERVEEKKKKKKRKRNKMYG